MKPKDETHSQAPPVAIIGMGCMFPRSPWLKAYWRLLLRGRDAVTEVPPTHWRAEDYFNPDPKVPDHVYCTRGGFIPPVTFDPSEFGIPPASLEATDTSQLLGLVAARMALTDAGYGDGKVFDRDRAGVILGVTGTQELVIPLGARLGHPHWRRALADCGVDPATADAVVERIAEAYVPWKENSFPGLLGNVVAGRICNRLDLGGTNCVVDAACASSMSAIHTALMEIRSDRADLMVTGGVDLLNDIFMHMCFSRTQILSPTGDARPFSGDADGTVLGEGIGLLVLKALDRAEADGDRIYAVIKGIGTSSDGRSQSIYAPRAEGQGRALGKAYAEAGIDPATVDLVEAHGTGTRVGDAVEFKALKTVFGPAPRNGRRCAVGSVKSMIGHTKAAAGAAGLIKAALALHHKVLPPTLKADPPDPSLGIGDSPFYLNNAARPWLSGGTPRRAGVSAFGFGGSNFHMVLEEYTGKKDGISWDGSVEIVALSGGSRAEIRSRLEALSAEARGASEAAASALAAETRRRFSPDAPHRLLWMAAERPEADLPFSERVDAVLRGLTAPDGGTDRWKGETVFTGGTGTPGRLAFVFPGQGSQYLHMGRDLACVFPEALEALEHADAAFEKAGGADGPLSRRIHPYPDDDPEAGRRMEAALRSTDAAQPAIGAMSAGMARILARFGVRPEAACGHSFGELTALWAAGWISEEAFHRLAAARGRAMADAASGKGTMLAVKAPLAEIEALAEEMGGDLVLANRNGPSQGVLSGSAEAVEEARRRCKTRGLVSTPLPVSAPFHSPLVAEAAGPFAEALAGTEFTPSEIPVFSNTTGAPYPADPEAAKEMLGRHILRPVDFIKEIEGLHDAGIRTFLEIGPRRVLTGLIREILAGRPAEAVALDPSGGRSFGVTDLATALCRLAALGHPVDLTAWESPPPPQRKPKMEIPLSGANYRTPSKPKPAPKVPPPAPEGPARPEPEPAKAPAAESPGTAPPTAAPPPRPQAHSPGRGKQGPRQGNDSERPTTGPEAVRREPRHAQPQDQGSIMEKDHSPHHPRTAPAGPGNPAVDRALDAVREGLRYMQSLQTQTARTHEKFLESQSEASRTLQEMMRATRRLAEAALGRHPTPEEPRRPAEPPAPADQPSPGGAGRMAEAPSPAPPASAPAPAAPQAGNGGPPEASTSPEEPASGTPEPRRQASPPPAADQVDEPPRPPAPESGKAPEPTPPGPEPGPSDGRIQEVLLEAVSELTGYPTEMLGPDMDIEADLGIDSIKRVEILSAVEERIPDLPPVSPEIMGTFRTLGAIIAHLDAAGARETEPAETIAGPTEDAPPPPSTGADPGAVENILLEVVSELTGYPAEMLGPDMDIEADLGIDSIKRVEILSAVEERIPDLPPVSPEIMGTFRTLGAITAHLALRAPEERSAPEAGTERPAEDPGPGIAAGGPPEPGTVGSRIAAPGAVPEGLRTDSAAPESEPAMEAVARRVVTLVPRPAPKGPEIDLPGGSTVVLTETAGGLDRPLVSALEGRGLTVLRRPPAELLEADMPSGLGGLILLADAWRHRDRDLAAEAFRLARRFGPALQEAAGRSGAVFGTIARMDGAFGFHGKGIETPVQGALAGLVKTAGIEWEGVTCRALDIDPAWNDAEAAAGAALAEILRPGPAEVGIGSDGRVDLVLTPAPHSEGSEGPVALGEGDVVVVSGGGRGVTALSALALAREVRPFLILLGRSPLPSGEPEWLAHLTDPAAMKRAILKNEFSGQAPSPRDLETRFRRYAADREIAATIEGIRAAGASVHYYPVDVCDAERINDILDQVRLTVGPIKGLIHGAGTLEDRRILDKTPEQFHRVYHTKVDGLKTLLAALQGDPLAYVVLFSSVAARAGNRGQVDYAMANEVLNKRAGQLAAERPDCRVLSLNWGPWDGGMVTDSLKREFRGAGVDLIPKEAGARAMVREMQSAPGGPVEVILGATLAPATGDAHPTPSVAAPEGLALTFKREIDRERYPVLESHVLDGRAVVPFALMTEWMGYGALHGNPGLFLHGLDDIRLLNGIRLGAERKLIRLLAGKPRRKKEGIEVDVEIRDGIQDGTEVVHYRARAILTDGPAAPPDLRPARDMMGEPYRRSVDEAYREVLFHGAALRGIREILGYSPKGMVARLGAAPPPEEWMAEPLRSRWIADPLVLDSAFQMAILWCRERKGMACLPVYAREYRQFRRRFPESGVTAVLEVASAGDRVVRGDFTFFDAEDRLVARLTGYEGVMAPSLSEAFGRGAA